MDLKTLRAKYVRDDTDERKEYGSSAIENLREKYLGADAQRRQAAEDAVRYEYNRANLPAQNTGTMAFGSVYGGGGSFGGDNVRELAQRMYTGVNYTEPEPARYVDISPMGAAKQLQTQQLGINVDDVANLRNALNQGQKAQQYKSFMDLANSDDFAQFSGYRSTKTYDRPDGLEMGPQSHYTDPLYEQINKNPELQRSYDDELVDLDSMKYQFLTDDEIKVFNYLYQKEGFSAANDFLNTIDMTERARKDPENGSEAYYAQQAKDEGWAATMGRNVLSSPLKAAGLVGNAVNKVLTGGIDQNAWYNAPSYIAQARDEAVTEDMSSVGKFAYQTGESIANFLYNGLIGGALGTGLGLSEKAVERLTLSLMSSQAAEDTLVDLKDKGYSDSDAIKLSALSGFAEYITERYSLETLLNMESLHSSKLLYWVKNALAEGSEEVASDMINLMGDIMIMKDKSEWEQSIQQYMDRGYSRQQAFGLAVKDQAVQSGLSFLGGAISGGVMAGGAVLGSNINAIRQGRDFMANNDTDALMRLAQEGQYNDERSAAYRSSARLQDTLQAGRNPSALQVGNVLQYQAQANAEEDLSNMILSDAIEHLNENDSITDEDAKAIRENQVAMQELRSVVPDMKTTVSGINEAVRAYVAAENDIETSDREQEARDFTGRGVTSEEARSAVQKRFGTDIDTFVESAARITDTVEAEHPELANTIRFAYNDIVNNSVERQMLSGEDFAATMIKAYNLGQEGKSAISLTKDMPQIAAAYVTQAQRLGVKEGEINGRINGDNDIQVRTDSNASAVAGSGMEAEGRRENGSTGTGREAYLSADPGETEPLAEVSNKQIFGDIGGEGNVRIVKPSKEFIKAAREVAKASGFTGTMHFTDRVMTANEGKGDFAVDGWISSDNNHIYANLHPAGNKTAMQTIIHELAHFEVRDDKTAVRTFRDNISKDKELADMIERGYKMLYDTDSSARAWEEAYCDAKAEINAFTGSYKLQETAKAVSEKKGKIQTALTEAQNPRAPTQPSMTKAQAAAALNGETDIRASRALDIEGQLSLSDLENYYQEKYENVSKANIKTAARATKGVIERIKNFQNAEVQKAKDNNVLGNVRTVALGVTSEFIKTGYIDFGGLKLDSDPSKAAGQIAAYAMILRNPNFETFRILYTRGDQIVGNAAVTSYNVDTAYATLDKDVETSNKMVRDQMRRLGADGYYLMHNHPSGDVSYSPQDKQMTAYYKKNINGLKGHIIIDHNKYGFFDATHDIRYSAHDIENGTAKDVHKRSIDSPLLYRTITGPDSVADIAKDVVHSNELSTLIYAHKDGVRAIQEVSNKFLLSKDFKNYVKNRKLDFGAVQTFLVSNMKTFNEVDKSNLYRTGIFTDVVGIGAEDELFGKSGYSMRELGRSQWRTNEEVELYRVYENADNKSSIRDQLRANLSDILKSGTIHSVKYNLPKNAPVKVYIDHALSVAKKWGYKFERQGFGSVVFDEKRIRKAFNYELNDVEIAAFDAIPYVVRRGRQLEGHENHKGRGYQTATFAGVVEINNVPYVLGVTVKQTGKNYYNVHRALVLTVDEMGMIVKEAEPTLGGGSSAELFDTPISSASNSKIAQESSAVKQRFSKAVDSTGRQLTEQQAEYFKDSKIRDRKGNLIPMYHGTDADFTVFNFDRGGEHGTAEGFGIYLASEREVSESYGGRIIEAYADIKRPARSDQKTIKLGELKKLIKGTCIYEANKLMDDGGYDKLSDAMRDTWISNYTDTYEKSMEASYDDVARSILRMNSSDMDIVQEIMAGMGIRSYRSAMPFYDFLTEQTGIDGFVTSWRPGNKGNDNIIALAFRSEQIKNVDNQSPTDNSDIRFSRVSDPEEIKMLNSEPTVTVYRAMQVIDGELYPPMAAKLKDDAGKNRLVEPTELGAWYRADERPDLIKDGKFALNKGNGSTPLNVAYNPYWHTSRSMLNDQFSSAYKRPNLVTVECEVPKSELTSGYKAEFAKDAVGEMQWHSGPVSSKLAKEGNPRRVILSRWVKVNRIVPDSEAAASIAEMLKGTDITIPENTVTPSLKEELIKQGVTVGDEGQSRFSKGTEKDNVPEIDADGVNELAEYIKNSGEKPNKAITEYLAALYEGRTFVLSDGDTAIMDHSDSKKLSIDTKKDRIATLNKLDEIITKAVLYATDDTPEHRKFVSFKYYAADVKFEGQVYPIQLNVGKARNDGENHIYAITNRKKMPSGTSAVTGPVGNTGGDQIPSIFSEDNLSHNANSVNTRMSRAKLPENADEEAAKVVDSLYRRASYNNMSMKYGNYNAAAYTDKRIEQEISYSYAEGSRNKDYARAYIAFVKPEEFIKATSSSIWRDQLYAEVKGKAKEEGRTSMLNLDALTNERQSMYLWIKTDENGRAVIDGHEGRHRMIGLEAEGYKYVPVIIEPREYGYPDGQSRYHTKPISSLYLEGQQFYEGHGTGFFVHDILPLSANYAEIAREVFASGDNVTRFSRGSDIDQMQLFTDDLKAQYAALQAEVQKQTERAEHFKGETRLKLEKEGADKYQVSDTGLTKIEQKLKKDYSSNASIRDDLRTLINDFMNGRADYDGAFNMAMYIGNHIVSEAKELVSPDDHVYRELRDYLRKTRISINASAKSDIADYEAFRRRNLNRIRLVNDGLPIDVAYQELQEMFGKSYFPDVIDTQSDQLMQIDDVLRTLTPVFENPYTSTSDAEMAVEAVAMDIMQTLMNSDEIDKVAPTFADRQKRQREKAVAKAKDQVRSYYEGRLTSLRNSKDKRIQELKDSAQRLRERRKDSEMRTKLLNIARRLQNRKLPAVQRQRLDEIIGDLDTVAKGITGRSIQNLTALRDWYEDRKQNDPDFLSDEVTEKRIERLEQRHISDMTQEEVLELTMVLQNIENEIAYGKKLIDDAERRTTYQLAEATINDIYGTAGTKAGLVEFADQTFVFGGLSGERAIRRMTGYVDSDPLYQATLKLSEGQRQMLDFQRRASALVQRFTEDKAFVDSITGKKARRITISGIENGNRISADITPAELISLYLHSKNDANLYHIEYGGITVPDFDLLTKGKAYEAYEKERTIKLRPSEVRAITAQMTDKERAFANAISEYFNGMSQKEINDVSEKLKGYSLAQVENYFPIETNKDFLKKDIATIENDGTIEGMGFLKERIQKESTPIMLREAQKVMNQSVTQTSKYVGLAIPVRNINKLLDVDLVNWADGEADLHQGTIRKAISDKWHDSGQSYLKQLMEDLQNRHTDKEKAINRLFNKITSNYAGAVLDMNLGVAIKQAASYPTAMAILGYKPLLAAMGQWGRVDLRLIEKYTPLQWYRSQGYSTTELGDMASGVSKDAPTWLKWIQGMDLITTRKLWKASEIYVQQNPASSELVRGSDEYYKEVARIYNRVIEETQPNYTVMQRPEALRSRNAITRALNMFKTQPYQNFGLLYDAVQNFKAKQTQYQTMRSSEAEFALKEARKHLSDAIVSQLVSALIFAGMQFLWDVLRHKTDKYEDDKGKADIGTIAKGFGMNALSSGFGMIPYGSVALEAVESATDKVAKELGGDAVFNQSFYGMDVPVLETLNNLIDGSGTAIADIVGIIHDVANGGEIGFENVRKIYKHTSDIFQTAGVPVKNTVNLLNTIMQNTAWTYQSLGGNYYMGNYVSLRIQGASNTQMYQNLYQAYKNNSGAYQELYNQMIEDGYSEKAIKNFFKKME